ncbi:MAG: hypothetical protein K9H48_12210 [Melioribacteraceae bacterium]|nr:hypothetical protein [Melioribacteraceae bacterium]MCF8395094.1 hypothetical protein [Melioribacteraceae bacterium]MCF8420359.1 hypothetical protein [Melioribacteraceae bacterium]
MYKYLFILVVLALFSCENNIKNDMWLGITVEDSLTVGKIILEKGNYVLINENRSTEEGLYIYAKKDSGIVYFKYINPLCWKKADNLESANDVEEKALQILEYNNSIVSLKTQLGDTLWLDESRIRRSIPIHLLPEFCKIKNIK